MFDGGLSVGILVNSAQVCECVCVEGGGGEGDTQVVRILNTQCGLQTNSSGITFELVRATISGPQQTSWISACIFNTIPR